MKKARYFYAEATFKTWPKLFVLTDDGFFHCKYLNYMKPASINLSFDFNDFKDSDYKFGGYQSIVEISYSQAIAKNLNSQQNWISEYIAANNIDIN